jgi:elongation factor 3
MDKNRKIVGPSSPNASGLLSVPSKSSVTLKPAKPSPASSADTLTNKLAAVEVTDVPLWDGNVRRTLESHQIDACLAVLGNKKATAAQKDEALNDLLSLLPAANNASKALLPWLLPLLPTLLDLYADRAKSTAELANKVTNGLMRLPSVWAQFPVVFPALLEVAKSSGTKAATRVAALKHLGAFIKRGTSRQVAEHLERVIEGIEPCLHDIADDVSKAAVKTLTDLCAVITNADIVQHVPLLVQTMARPNEVASCLDKISRTTFVATVDGPSLAIMMRTSVLKK